MNVSADYKLDFMAGITQHFSAVLYDGQMIPLALRGEKYSVKEPFPPGTKVQVLHDGEYHE
jgi:hypothetical protein